MIRLLPAELKLTLLLYAYLSLACASTTESRLDSDAALVTLNRARVLFETPPRTAARVREAYKIVTGDGSAFHHDMDRGRYENAAKYALWLALASSDKSIRAKYAGEARMWSDKIVAAEENAVEGYYYRGVAGGILAESNLAAARTAMFEIRRDAAKAVALNPAFEHAGPHRLLGALYLRAPGPPAGIGSRKLALQHLEKARDIAPEYPENLNFLAEIYAETDRCNEALRLLDQVLGSQWPDGVLVSAKQWRSTATELQRRCLQSGKE